MLFSEIWFRSSCNSRSLSLARAGSSGESVPTSHQKFFFGADIAHEDEQIGEGRKNQVMMKATPRPSFEMVQPQIVLGALQVLLNMPARATQSQAASFHRRPLEMGQVIMIRLGVAGSPVHHQPSSLQVAITLPQLVLQIHPTPSQPRVPRLLVRRPPRARLPLRGGKGCRNLSQSASGLRSYLGATAPVPDPTRALLTRDDPFQKSNERSNSSGRGALYHNVVFNSRRRAHLG
jgi:hypothetical protein